MKTAYWVVTIFFILISLSVAFAYNCPGGDGSSDLNISTNTTWASATDYNCNNVFITNGSMLTFNSRTAGSKITLYAASLTIDENSKISSDDYGSLNGAGSGAGGAAYAGGGGAGYGGAGGAGSGAGGAAFGVSDMNQPTSFGSGGGTSTNYSSRGGYGGGAIRLIVSGTITNNGIISSNGGMGAGSGGYVGGSGSGGSVWIDANILTGIGRIDANGGPRASGSAGGGGGGRIAIYVQNNSSLPAINVFGSSGSGSNGSIFLSANNSDFNVPSLNTGDLNVFRVKNFYSLITSGSNYRFVVVNLSGDFNGSVSAGLQSDTNISGANIYPDNITSGKIKIVSTNLNLASGKNISANGLGNLNAAGAGAGGAGYWGAGGAGYGGAGSGGSSGAGGASFGLSDMNQPTALGSGGGTSTNYTTPGGYGGGAIRLIINGTLTNEGIISSNGTPGSGSGSAVGGSGSGGSIWIDANVLTGTGRIDANGGMGVTSAAGAGGGGRIAVYVLRNSFISSINTMGGSGSGTGSRGSVFISSLGYDFNIPNVYAGDVNVTGVRNFYSSISSSGNSRFVVFNLIGDFNGSITSGLQSDVNITGVNINPSTIIGGRIRITATSLTLSSGNTISANALGSINSAGTGAGGAAYNGGGGGGYGGAGGAGSGSTGGIAYGSMSQPTDLGSGGGLSTNYGNIGGYGGGAIRIILSGALANDGIISSNGGTGTSSSSYAGGSGSGGSIWIDAGSLLGTGRIDANGGVLATGWSGGGAGGRIALYVTGASTMGAINTTASGSGSNGTVYISSTGSDFNVPTIITGDTNFLGIRNFFGTITSSGSSRFNLITINGDFNGSITAGLQSDVNITGGNLYPDTIIGGKVKLVATNISIASGKLVSTNALGNVNSAGAGAGGAAYNGGGGGGYGGAGGAGSGSAGGAVYGASDANQPTALGSGGGLSTNYGNIGGYGGGAIRIIASGTFSNNGIISSNGGLGTSNSSYAGGSGSGGSIWITTNKFNGAGRIDANGAPGITGWAGCGGGGRIAIWYDTNTFSGNIIASAGCGGGGAGSRNWVYSYAGPNYILSGSFTSKKINLAYGKDFNVLNFDVNLPSGTNVSFKLRTASNSSDLDNSPWLGPSGTTASDDNYSTSGTAISGVHDGNSWVQWKAFLSTASATSTPIVFDVNIMVRNKVDSNAVFVLEKGVQYNWLSLVPTQALNGGTINWYYCLTQNCASWILLGPSGGSIGQTNQNLYLLATMHPDENNNSPQISEVLVHYSK